MKYGNKTMATKYPWYEVVQGEGLLQGDFLGLCPVIVPPRDFPAPRNDAKTMLTPEAMVKIRQYDVVIMSQSCDLVEKKLDLVLVCPHWSMSEVEKDSQFFRGEKGKEAIRKGNVPGYHLLNKCTIRGFERGYRVVDFRSVFSLPVDFIVDFAHRKGRRLRLLPPYREHLSQAFARFFMRVGLPADIPPFR